MKYKYQKNSSGQNKRYKNCSFYFRELQLITVLHLICDSYMSSSTRFASLKLCVGFCIFDSASFLFKFIFLFNKTDMVTNFLNLENRSFENVSFSQ